MKENQEFTEVTASYYSAMVDGLPNQADPAALMYALVLLMASITARAEMNAEDIMEKFNSTFPDLVEKMEIAYAAANNMN